MQCTYLKKRMKRKFYTHNSFHAQTISFYTFPIYILKFGQKVSHFIMKYKTPLSLLIFISNMFSTYATFIHKYYLYPLHFYNITFSYFPVSKVTTQPLVVTSSQATLKTNVLCNLLKPKASYICPLKKYLGFYSFIIL